MDEGKQFFENLKAWSLRKLRLLGKYLPPFIAKVATSTNDRIVYCVDGFAGAATYDDGCDGSPLITARAADICARWQNPVDLRIINVEPKYFGSLENATKHWVDRQVVWNLEGRFEDRVDAILAKVANSPALFFIDPFGPTDIPFSNLEPILKRENGITELIINFDVDGLNRIACAAVSPKVDFKTASSNSSTVTAVLGSSRWEEFYMNRNIKTAERETFLLTEYMSGLGRFGFNVVAYPIREYIDKRPKYQYVYCTRHVDGLLLMNEFIRAEDDLIYGEFVENELPLFSDGSAINQEVATRRGLLIGLIAEMFSESTRLTRREIRHRIVRSYFAMFSEKDLKWAVNELILDGQIAESSGKKRINDEDILQLKLN